MFTIEGQFYAKVNYMPHIYNDGLLHKKLGIDNLDYEDREERLIDMDEMEIEGLRTVIELYVIATPTMDFGKHPADNTMYLQLHLEDSEWDKIEDKLDGDDLEDIVQELETYSDLYQVQYINKDEYISKTQLNSVS